MGHAYVGRFTGMLPSYGGFRVLSMEEVIEV